MKLLPAILHRPGALIGAGLAAWPLTAYAVASAAGIDGCVRAHGLVGFFATHGAMMRATPSCPSASVGLSGSMEAVMAIVLPAATLTVLAHVFVALASSRLAQWVHRAVEAIRKIITPVLALASSPLNFRLPPLVRAQHVGRVVSLRVPWRRGPPIGMMAAA